MKNEHEPYILGLDLGVQSIGWAILDADAANQPQRVRVAGVRCFDSGVGSETQIEMGKDESGNTKRRDARQHRRQLWRRARRLGKIFHLLQRAGLLPAGPAKSSEERHQLLLQIDSVLAAQYGGTGDRVANHVLPYRLRALALDGGISSTAVGRAIYHLAQRRGFLSNKKAKKADEEEGQVKADISELRTRITDSGSRTLGEYFAGLDPEEHRIRGRWTGRDMYVEEFDAIWNNQSPQHTAMTDALRGEIHRAMFYQRPLKSQKGLVGKCDLEPGQRRAPAASLPAQRFRYWQKINDLRIITPDREEVSLTDEQRQSIAALCELQAEISFAGLRKLLGIKKLKGAEGGFEFNLEAGGEKGIKGNRTASKLRTALGDYWDAMNDCDRERLIHEILVFEKEDALARRLRTAWNFSADVAAKVAAIDLEPGYSALSLRAIRNLLPQMEAGVQFATARKAAYGEMGLGSNVHELLPPILQAVPQLRNPVVSRALSELRKVVNAIVRRYGKPVLVRVEMARDMKRGRKAREDAWKRSRDNEEWREAAKLKIRADIGSEPRPGDILKVRLAEECGWQCPYTGRQIKMQALVGQNPQFDIEHIWPFSGSLDDSFANKTLCYHEENRSVKGNRMPLAAYVGDPDKWHAIIERVKRFHGPLARVKLERFRAESIPDDFVSKQLSDTRYITSLAGNYVGLLFGGQIDSSGCRRVQTSTGRMTAFLRDELGLNSVLSDGGEKNRDDHRHHAVDALAIALIGPSTVEQLSRAAERASEQGRRLFARIGEPWEGFLNEARKSIETIRVSYRVNRRLSGALHKDTLYSKAHQSFDKKGKRIEVRHVRKLLKDLSSSAVDQIVDIRVRSLVKAKLDGGDPKKVFSDESNHPYFMSRDGRIIPIHKARISERVAVIPVGRENAHRFAVPKTNHHIEIVAVVDSEGREKNWKSIPPVSLIEAVRRADLGLPVAQQDFGPGMKFRFSLCKNEYVEMEFEPGERRLYRVVAISEGDIEFHLHSDGRPTIIQGRIRIRGAPARLYKAKARKVAIDPLGNVFPAND